jgi:hypothetical protein
MSKEIKVSLAIAKKTAAEFGDEAQEKDGVVSIIVRNAVKKSIQEEDRSYNTFYFDGLVYVSAPATPLPMKVVELEEHSDGTVDVEIQILPLTEEYGLVYRRQIINFIRNIRFFLMEIHQDFLHYSEVHPQAHHPLEK